MTISELRRRLRYAYQSIINASMDAVYAYIADFDELHVLNDTTILYDKFNRLAQQQANRTADDIEDYLLKLCKSHPNLVRDKQYPIRETLRNNHAKIAKQASIRVAQSKAQGKTAKEIAKYIKAYMERAYKHATDSVIFYEVTRTETDNALADADDDAYFRTICIHDNRACKVCLAIEEEQEQHPVRVSDAATGINCPPFHPFCRCRVVIL